MPITHEELKSLASEKSADARLLFDNGRYSNAYYLAGYAVEIGLKAVIAKKFRAGEIPDKKFVADIYSHDLRSLVGYSELKTQLDRARRKPRFDANWVTVEKWKADHRYAMFARVDAEAIVLAVDEKKHGVLEWIRSHW
jgi:HEPN domain-containing protein